MTDLHGPPPPGSHPPPFQPPPVHHPRWPIFLALGLAVLLGVAAWYFFLRAPKLPDVNVPQVPVADAGPAAPAPASLSGTDPHVREVVGQLSKDPDFTRWLMAEDLVRRFVSAVTAIGNGESPRTQLPFMAPQGPFKVTSKRGGKVVIAPESFSRYDPVARAVTSVDTQSVNRVYQELKPLLDSAYGEIAPPGNTFEQALAGAIGKLVAVPVPDGDIQVKAKGAMYTFADEDMEARSASEKHLLRMGPENQRKVQVKLAELAGALGLPLPAGVDGGAAVQPDAGAADAGTVDAGG
ncbi:DUF3014 domain-containing protein [Aggregicoccus sp. 17bor-14]|uniref:DUF3014 domain-containing protein n=1 Tax=Myxococcaceae TaxID=31 RepID=UPI00129C3931|nr:MULTISPECIES: DUF3014 domain-containing protein [Myxococcaceae]MBF5041596.1 DUF3014 domain-containing protein [Simulacricoccus sp. 17bor-14]MRI87381.1 DUF3014 domain-containing protein [Aggregicoccus sp. 17bor-14]